MDKLKENEEDNIHETDCKICMERAQKEPRLLGCTKDMICIDQNFGLQKNVFMDVVSV